MTIGKIPYNAFPSIGSALSASGGNRVSLPVTPSSYIYSHFRHVSGVPAEKGGQGVSVSQLKMLDSLIGEIVRLNEQPKPSFDIQTENHEKRFNAIVENLQKQVSSAQAANAASPYPAVSPDMGIMFSLSV
jgi:hypothetical protein